MTRIPSPLAARFIRNYNSVYGVRTLQPKVLRHALLRPVPPVLPDKHPTHGEVMSLP
jgi:hypothetical protein